MAIKFLNTVAVDDSVLFVDTVNDRVGIGTDSPYRALQVGDGTADDSIGVYYSDSSYMRLHGYGVYMSRAASYIRPVTTTTQTLYVGHTSNIWNAITNNANTHYFSTGTNEHMRILSNGKVGIGVTAPQKELSVYGDTLIESSGLTASLWFRPSATYTSGGIQTMKVTGSGNPYHTTTSFSNYNAANVLNIVNDKVGIGTTSPGQKLSVDGNVEITTGGNTYLNVNHGNVGFIKFTDTSIATPNQFLIQHNYAQDNDFRIARSTGGQDFVIDSSGKVGIGTASPTAKLDIEGDLQVKGVNISNQENLDVDTGTETIATVVKATYDAAFFDFVIKNGTNLRAGTVFAIHDGTNVEFTETSTNDLGDTSDVTLSVDISGTDMRLRATTTTDNWIIKSLVRTI